ncbi:DNA alkylation repair protein [Microaceticoccus formicicus]|uniref:DNA alkylation repair protein n=1 Tax=Microaceticoccus formicicus TaxID=3118105 RepID=UPI003CD03F22|nr:DNA alkylation repair protein [Peptoniphilaceae bacterium AMB_02]
MEKYLEIKKRFELNKNPDIAVQMEAYMRYKFKFYGIKTPERRALYKEFLKGELKNKVVDWEFLESCYEDEHREFQYLVTDYLHKMQRYLVYDDAPKILGFAKRKQWWDTIDNFNRIIGRIGLVDTRINQLMLELSLDEDFWLRRIAIDHQLSRKDKTDTELLEEILINNLGSDEFFINKAIGWSLRDYSKTNPEWVRGFLNKYRSKMDKLSIAEASKYI